MFPNACVIVPFREPIQHAFSLLKQHRKFCDLQGEDEFVRKYMAWLCHFEFGLDQKQFSFDENDLVDRDIMSIEYWLDQWVLVYGHCLKTCAGLRENFYFVGYEDLCAEDSALWSNLRTSIEIRGSEHFEFSLQRSEPPSQIDRALQIRADEIYAELGELSHRQLHIT